MPPQTTTAGGLEPLCWWAQCSTLWATLPSGPLLQGKHVPLSPCRIPAGALWASAAGYPTSLGSACMFNFRKCETASIATSQPSQPMSSIPCDSLSGSQQVLCSCFSQHSSVTAASCLYQFPILDMTRKGCGECRLRVDRSLSEE